MLRIEGQQQDDGSGTGSSRDSDSDEARQQGAKHRRSRDSRSPDGRRRAQTPKRQRRDNHHDRCFGEEEEDVEELEFRLAVDVETAYRATQAPLTPGDVQLLKYVIAASLYPRIAMPFEQNPQRREQDARFFTTGVAELVVHLGSSLVGGITSLPHQVPHRLLLLWSLLAERATYISKCKPVILTSTLPAALLYTYAALCGSSA